MEYNYYKKRKKKKIKKWKGRLVADEEKLVRF